MSVFYKLQLTDAGLRYSTQLFFNIQPQKYFLRDDAARGRRGVRHALNLDLDL